MSGRRGDGEVMRAAISRWENEGGAILLAAACPPRADQSVSKRARRVGDDRQQESRQGEARSKLRL